MTPPRFAAGFCTDFGCGFMSKFLEVTSRLFHLDAVKSHTRITQEHARVSRNHIDLDGVVQRTIDPDIELVFLHLQTENMEIIRGKEKIRTTVKFGLHSVCHVYETEQAWLVTNP